jgi:nitrogen fixation protein FixH
MIFALIGLNFCVVGLTVHLSSRRASSHAVEPDYDRTALNWNQSARQMAHNRELGWSLLITEITRNSIAVSLTGRDGQAIKDAKVSLQAFHHAHARNRLHADLAEIDNLYRGSVVIDTPGLWEFRFTVKSGPEKFTTTLTRIVTEQGS